MRNLATPWMASWLVAIRIARLIIPALIIAREIAGRVGSRCIRSAG
ncbi:hypothetical protein [Corynebacterium glutamicum]|nr:hypothetical protein [Corynebacterium glutamicum]